MHMEEAFSNEPAFSNHCSSSNMKRLARKPCAYYEVSSRPCSTVTNQNKAKQGTQYRRVIQVLGSVVEISPNGGVYY